MKNALELLKASATAAPTNRVVDPVVLFMSKVDAQIELVKQVKDGKDVNVRSLWFKEDKNEFVVHIGRSALTVAGSQYFRAKDLNAVIDILTAAKEAIGMDKQLQAQITKDSKERNERLKQARAKGKEVVTAE